MGIETNEETAFLGKRETESMRQVLRAEEQTIGQAGWKYIKTYRRLTGTTYERLTEETYRKN